MSKIMIFRTITEKQAQELLENKSIDSVSEFEQGRYIVNKSDGTYTAIDNSMGLCIRKDFESHMQAIRYLCEEYKG